VQLSIVIVNWNGGADILQCLASLQACGWIAAAEVVVVDNGSEDDSVARIRRAFPSVLIIETGANLGFARAANIGWRQTRGEFVLFLNPDTCVPAGTLERALQYMRTHSEAGVMGVKLLNYDGSLQVSCWNFLSVPMLVCDNLLRLPIFPRSLAGRFLYRLWDHATTREVDWVCGACMFVRRSILEKVNGVSEDYFMYGEDMDLCYKVRQQGYTVVYYPEAAIVHYGNRSGEKRWAERREAEIVRAELTFLRKYRGRLAWGLFRTLAGGAFAIKAALFFLRGRSSRAEKWDIEAARYWQMVKMCWRGSGQLM
jgi:hypothetical protein